MQRGFSGELSPFFQKPFISVKGYISREEGRVKIEASDSHLLIFFKLVKAGYGSLEEVKKMNAEEVLQALYYESFLVDYEIAYRESLS